MAATVAPRMNEGNQITVYKCSGSRRAMPCNVTNRHGMRVLGGDAATRPCRKGNQPSWRQTQHSQWATADLEPEDWDSKLPLEPQIHGEAATRMPLHQAILVVFADVSVLFGYPRVRSMDTYRVST